MEQVCMTDSRSIDRPTSRKVQGYVKAARRLQKLQARLDAKEQELLPLRREVTEAKSEVAQRHQAMTGGQMGEALRILKERQEVSE